MLSYENLFFNIFFLISTDFDQICANMPCPVVQNLTKFLVNVLLKFLSWNMANT